MLRPILPSFEVLKYLHLVNRTRLFVLRSGKSRTVRRRRGPEIAGIQRGNDRVKLGRESRWTRLARTIPRSLEKRKKKKKNTSRYFRLREKSRSSSPVSKVLPVEWYTSLLTHWRTFDPGPVWKPSPRRDCPGVCTPGRVFLVATHGRSTPSFFLRHTKASSYPWMLAPSRVF